MIVVGQGGRAHLGCTHARLGQALRIAAARVSRLMYWDELASGSIFRTGEGTHQRRGTSGISPSEGATRTAGIRPSANSTTRSGGAEKAAQKAAQRAGNPSPHIVSFVATEAEAGFNNAKTNAVDYLQGGGLPKQLDKED